MYLYIIYFSKQFYWLYMLYVFVKVIYIYIYYIHICYIYVNMYIYIYIYIYIFVTEIYKKNVGLSFFQERASFFLILL